MKLAVVTASLDPEKTRGFWTTWREHARWDYTGILVLNGFSRDKVVPPWGEHLRGEHFQHGICEGQILGVVPAFALGVAKAIEQGADIIACLHDDVRIDTRGWDTYVQGFFEQHPMCGLAGFGGALGLGDKDIYRKRCPDCAGTGVILCQGMRCSRCGGHGTGDFYSPMQLARRTFGSNMENAESHGQRWLLPRRVACLDGFSQIGRREFFAKAWPRLMELGIVHHAYDSMLGAFAARAGWEVWFLPVQVHHHGGLTAVANGDYQAWAKTQEPGGDAGFWEKAHRIFYEECRGVLPIDVET